MHDFTKKFHRCRRICKFANESPCFAQVSEKPMEDDDHEEGGVVMGSITLGGDWPQNVREDYSVSYDVHNISDLFGPLA